jgi:hypothetical protein
VDEWGRPDEKDRYWRRFYRDAVKRGCPKLDSSLDPVGSIYHMRLLRDGWRDDTGGAYEKDLPRGWVLRKIVLTSRGEMHQLLQPKKQLCLDFPSWEWADWDYDRLIWAEEGCLYRSELGPKGSLSPKLVRDFSTMKFERIKAPY